VRERHGRSAERLVARHLTDLGWTVLATGVRIGRDEIDMVAIDPGPPRSLVVVEVRSVASSRFGVPEASVDRGKVGRLYRGLGALRAAGSLPSGEALPRLPWRVDLVAVEDAPSLGPGLGGPTLRHLKNLEPA
jgi:Holliday junction resolvase-like predicted endonuclease